MMCRVPFWLYWRSARQRTARAAATFLLFIPVSASLSAAQKARPCQDGDHFEIDLKEIALQYDGSSFAGTVSGLNLLGFKLNVAPQKLQNAERATQQWNQILLGLAAGYNSCAVTKQQYFEGVRGLYLQLKVDADDLEKMRVSIKADRKTDEKHLEAILDRYYQNLLELARISGTDEIIIKLNEVVQAVQNGNTQIINREDQIMLELRDLRAEIKTRLPVPQPPKQPESPRQ